MNESDIIDFDITDNTQTEWNTEIDSQEYISTEEGLTRIIIILNRSNI